MSLFFYAWGEPRFVIVLMLSIAVNYLLALRMEEDGVLSRKTILAIAIVFNISILFVFKYLIFTLRSLNLIPGLSLPVPAIHLPAGISFFTFQAMSYVIDVYRGQEKAQHNLLNTALYISFFPQLIAGPIVRYGTFAGQIRRREISYDDFAAGMERFVLGLGKKVLLADQLAIVADQSFSLLTQPEWMGAYTPLSAGMAWLGAVSHMLQVYYDFSGYSDMAIGLARMFGFRFSENFNYPYIACSITEYWRRWHISLGTWFRDYLYIPLGGSRVSKLKYVRNLLIVWLCTGLWHGASWTFVVWGLMFFCILLFEKVCHLKEAKKQPLLRGFQHIYALLAAMTGSVLARSESVRLFFAYIKAMFTPAAQKTSADMFTLFSRQYLFWLAAGIFFAVPVVPFLKKKFQGNRAAAAVFSIFLIGVFLVSVSFVVKGAYHPFIYFNF